MKLVLPPKRFQSAIDPKYDPIRPRKWFAKLARRRNKIPKLKQAYCAWKADQGSQKTVAESFGVNERELRGYAAFVEKNLHKPQDPAFTHILNGAYKAYCEKNAIRHIRSFIRVIAPLYGVNPRHVEEAWESDPNFYPAGYDLL